MNEAFVLERVASSSWSSSFLSRFCLLFNQQQGSYDSSTSSYESYNRLGLTLSLAAAGSNNGHGGSGMVDPLMTGSPTTGGPPHMSSSNKYSSSSHDPYRYTRSTSQPVRSPTELTSPASKPQQQQQHRYVLMESFLSLFFQYMNKNNYYFKQQRALGEKSRRDRQIAVVVKNLKCFCFFFLSLSLSYRAEPMVKQQLV